jgi:hypothetical protein
MFHELKNLKDTTFYTSWRYVCCFTTNEIKCILMRGLPSHIRKIVRVISTYRHYTKWYLYVSLFILFVIKQTQKHATTYTFLTYYNEESPLM